MDVTQQSNMDLNLADNHDYIKPLDQGWKRELVLRTNNKHSCKITADVYYYTPHQQKVRSMRNISLYLSDTELTEDNFTFAKCSLGINDPEKEVIRDAILKSSSKKRRAKIDAPKVVKIPKIDISEVPKPQSSSSATAPMTSKGTDNKKTIPMHVIVESSSMAKKGNKIKRNLRKEKPPTFETNALDDEIEIDIEPPNWECCVTCRSRKEYGINGAEFSTIFCKYHSGNLKMGKVIVTPYYLPMENGYSSVSEQPPTHVTSPSATMVNSAATTVTSSLPVATVTSSQAAAVITLSLPHIIHSIRVKQHSTHRASKPATTVNSFSTTTVTSSLPVITVTSSP